jgi:hypothetical protein
MPLVKALRNSKSATEWLRSMKCFPLMGLMANMPFHGYVRFNFSAITLADLTPPRTTPHSNCQTKPASKARTHPFCHFKTYADAMETEGAALPLAALTAAVGLYASEKLDLPQPWSPATKPTPLLIYGASSAVGYYVLQLAIKSNLHPLICIAGRASAHVEKLLDKSKGDTVVDYRK